jgi:O-antigen ligase
MNLMQTRSAMLAGIAAAIVTLIFDRDRRLSRGRALALLLFVPVVALLVIGVGAGGKLSDAVSNIFLLNDAHRGVESGGSGRSDLWQWSLEIFQQSPLVGHNLTYFESIGFIGSHNFVLYGLAQYGLMSLFLFGSIIYAYISLARRNTYRFAVLACAIPLLFFNDRFTNLNPYPFIFFILLTTASPGDGDSREVAAGYAGAG